HFSRVRTRSLAGYQCRPRGACARGLRRRFGDRRRRTPQAQGRHIDQNPPRQLMRGRPWSWITGRPRLTDGLVVLFNLVFGVLAVVVTYFREAIPLPALLLVLVESLPLWNRRRQPVLILAVVACAEIVKWALDYSHEPSGPALLFAVYAVSVYDRGPARVWVAGAAIALIAVAVGLLLIGDFQVSRNLIPAGATSLVAWVIGDYMRSRRRFFDDLVAQHRKERELAAEEERLRIARELHDVVAHNVSVMAIQAGAARVSGESSQQALESIEQSARDTLSELNKLLGVLRKSPGGPELAPQPTLDDLDALLKPDRDARARRALRWRARHRLVVAGRLHRARQVAREDLIRVAIADDQAMVRAGFRLIVQSQKDMQVAGEASDGNEAVELARRERPHVVLMDIRMPRMDGIEATRQIA